MQILVSYFRLRRRKFEEWRMFYRRQIRSIRVRVIFHNSFTMLQWLVTSDTSWSLSWHCLAPSEVDDSVKAVFPGRIIIPHDLNLQSVRQRHDWFCTDWQTGVNAPPLPPPRHLPPHTSHLMMLLLYCCVTSGDCNQQVYPVVFFLCWVYICSSFIMWCSVGSNDWMVRDWKRKIK